MQVASTTKNGVTIVSPTGVIDTRSAQAFEAMMVKAFGEGVRSFAVDFSRVELITSAGIRVLVMMAHRLQRGAGGLVLFALGDRVRTVFEIGGLLQQFRIVTTEQQALEALSAPKPAKASEKARVSRLTGLVFDTVCPDVSGQSPVPSDVADRGRPSVLTATVVDALGRWSPPGSEST